MNFLKSLFGTKTSERQTSRPVMKVIALIFLSVMAWTASQAAPFYTSGNDFLRVCDPDGAFARSLPPDVQLTTNSFCTMWVVGVVQGLGIEDQLRPVPISKGDREQQDKAAKEYQQFLEKQFGIKPDVTLPNADICIPADATNMQYLRVVLAYMKSHPESLTSHAALLAVAALKNAWACPVK